MQSATLGNMAELRSSKINSDWHHLNQLRAVTESLFRSYKEKAIALSVSHVGSSLQKIDSCGHLHLRGFVPVWFTLATISFLFDFSVTAIPSIFRPTVSQLFEALTAAATWSNLRHGGNGPRRFIPWWWLSASCPGLFPTGSTRERHSA